MSSTYVSVQIGNANITQTGGPSYRTRELDASGTPVDVDALMVLQEGTLTMIYNDILMRSEYRNYDTFQISGFQLFDSEQHLFIEGYYGSYGHSMKYFKMPLDDKAAWGTVVTGIAQSCIVQ